VLLRLLHEEQFTTEIRSSGGPTPPLRDLACRVSDPGRAAALREAHTLTEVLEILSR
jgi:hypothetical protein